MSDNLLKLTDEALTAWAHDWVTEAPPRVLGAMLNEIIPATAARLAAAEKQVAAQQIRVDLSAIMPTIGAISEATAKVCATFDKHDTLLRDIVIAARAGDAALAHAVNNARKHLERTQ